MADLEGVQGVRSNHPLNPLLSNPGSAPGKYFVFVLLVSGYQFCHIRGWREGLICLIFLTIVVINDFYFATGVY